jgi:hypothetical protein
MKTRMLTAGAVLLAALLPAVPARAGNKISPDVRFAFEKTFRPKLTYAVVMQKGVPTTSIYGVKGDSTDAHYSIDVVDGRWKTSSGLLDFDQTMADFLSLGEVMELDSIAYRDNRIDLRLVSLEAHKVTRGSGWAQKTKPEPVATNFKFFLPYPPSKVLTPADVPEVIRYVGAYLKPFQDQNAARVYAARLLAGGGLEEPAARRGAAAKPAATSKKELKVGMTALEVIEIMGKPQSEVSFQSQTKWTYPQVTVIFENGRVKEVRF